MRHDKSATFADSSLRVAPRRGDIIQARSIVKAFIINVGGRQQVMSSKCNNRAVEQPQLCFGTNDLSAFVNELDRDVRHGFAAELPVCYCLCILCRVSQQIMRGVVSLLST